MKYKCILVICLLAVSKISVAQKHSIALGFGKEPKQSLVNLRYIKKVKKHEWGFGAQYSQGGESESIVKSELVTRNNLYVSGGVNLSLKGDGGENLRFAYHYISSYKRHFNSIGLQVNHNFFFNKNKDAHFEDNLQGFYIGNTLSCMITRDNYAITLNSWDLSNTKSNNASYSRTFKAISFSGDIGYRKYFGNTIFMQFQVSMVFYAGRVYFFSKGYPTRGFQPSANICVGYTFVNY